jgi:polyisoprenyl-phosphate glycosyltransferase
MNSLVIPVYKNEANLDRLLAELVKLAGRAAEPLEVVFVVDGSPDRCLEILRERLPALPVPAQLISLSRNFGSFAAIAAGMERARGENLAVMAADLQEPPEFALQSMEVLASGRADIVFGVRGGRSDPWLSELASDFFWALYRTFVIKDIPRGGVDMFACTRAVRDQLLQLQGVGTNLIALLFWLGYRREYIVYERRPRLEGKSAWTLKRKIRYAMDSIFNFTDLPVQILLWAGTLALALAIGASLLVLIAKLHGDIAVPGYTPIVLATLFFGALTSLGFGIVGQYLWLGLEVSRRRPNFVVHTAEQHGGKR